MKKEDSIRYVVHFGPDIDEKGGVATVISGILNSKVDQENSSRNIATTKSRNKLYVFIKSLVSFIKSILVRKIDVAHIHMASRGSFCRKSIIVLLCKIFKVPCIIHMHGACFDKFYSSMNNTLKKYCRYIFKQADKVIVLSESWGEFFKSWVDEDKIIVINNSVTVDSKYKKVYENNFVSFLFMGRCGERKGVYDLLDVVEKIKNDGYTHLDFKLILAGDGDIDNINKVITDKELDNIVITTGWVNKEKRDELLKNSDVFVLPSYNEGLPMAMLEAMSYYLPCVVTKVGGMPEVINDGIEGFISNPGDKEALYRNLLVFIKDKEKINSMGNSAFKTVFNNYNHEKKMKEIYELYKILYK